MRFKFYDEWILTKIGDHIIQEGKRAKDKELLFTPYSINNINGFVKQNDQWEGKSYINDSKDGYKVVKYNNLVYNPARINVGSIGIFKDNYGIVSSLYIVFSVKKDLNPNFLFKYMKTSIFNRNILKLQEGGVRSYFFYDKLKKSKIFIPSYEEQTKIIFFLDLIDKRINTQKKIIEELIFLKKGISFKLLYNQTTDYIPLKNFGILKNGYAFKSNEYVNNGKYKIITISNVTGEKCINIKTCNKIATIPKDLQSHQILKNNDILISLTGNVGRVSLCESNDCLLNQRVGVFELNNKKYFEFIFQCLSNPKFEKEMILKGQGAAQLNIGKDDIETFKIPNFNELKIDKVCNILAKLDDKIFIENKILNEYIKEKNFFLSKLFI